MAKQGVNEEISDSELLEVDLEAFIAESLDVGNSQNSSMQGCSPGRNDTGRSVEASCSTQKPLLSGNSDLMVSLKRKRNVANKNPMQHFHLQHLWVTDVSSQSWCELQVVHGFEKPDVRKTVNDDPVVLAGSSVHLARELEEHDVVSVSTESREDHWAAKFLNVLTGLTMLKESGRVRELPVFGQVEGIFLVGVIDELHYSPKGELTLSELKTRLRKSLPSAAQRRTHDLQAGIYRLLFDRMVQGKLESQTFVQSLKLRPDKQLAPGVCDHAQAVGFHVCTFSDALELLLLNLTYMETPNIDNLKIEYVHQSTGAPLGIKEVQFSEPRLLAELHYLLSYWTGQREPQGVDIEDSWKCGWCVFTEHCEWRKATVKNTGQSVWNKRRR
ncbi:EXO5 Exonuclease, partial [Polypterus senegalus]|nr:exonuclease V [Polypterus senegalus]XP_039612852.1 exonuclease V [Polypterus senegalus]MBN3292826.1 EXO5 Exonuclease [Polypterus senegalus]